MSETVCPLCELPRPRGAKRCVCNYTFEYDRPGPRVLGGGGGRASVRVDGILLAVTLVAAGVAFVLARGVERPPEDPFVATWLVLIGMFTLFGAFAAPRWFMGNARARRVVWLFGNAGARGFYALIGGAFVGGALGFFAHA